jgi:hypothetical protein
MARMSRRAEIECVLDAKATLGEGTFWDTREQVLWWVNIWGKQIHCFDPAAGLNRTWPVPEDVGCLAVRERGSLVVSRGAAFSSSIRRAVASTRSSIGRPAGRTPIVIRQRKSGQLSETSSLDGLPTVRDALPASPPLTHMNR